MHSSSVNRVSAKRRMILVVDDEPFILQYVGQVLRQASYQVMTAGNGDQAWSILEQKEIHLVLTDIIMPGALDGLALAQKIREKHLSIPVLFITGAVPEGDDRTAELVSNGFLLRKPFFPKQLLDFIGTRFTLSSS
jgi:two-component system, OmpR family, alkaline phosphatase synthesis response regulator PhoP